MIKFSPFSLVIFSHYSLFSPFLFPIPIMGKIAGFDRFPFIFPIIGVGKRGNYFPHGKIQNGEKQWGKILGENNGGNNGGK
jgi:hypothetical protein